MLQPMINRKNVELTTMEKTKTGYARGVSMPPKWNAFTVRVRTPLHTKLVKAAKANNRSLNAQVEFDLSRIYK